MYILGYIQRDSRIYLADKDVNVTSYGLSLPVVEYQTLVLRGDMETAAEVLPSVPSDQLNKIARFLQDRNHMELALEVATDPEHKFELALALNRLEMALELAQEADAEHKWKTVGDAALAAWDVALAEKCFTQARDLGSLLLLYSSTSDREGLAKLAELAEAGGVHNLAFSAQWMAGNVAGCVDILVKTGRLAEAVLFSQTYKPSLTADLVAQWKQSLEKNKKGRVAKLLGMPGEDEELFPEWEEWLRLETEGGSVEDKANGVSKESKEASEASEAESSEAESGDA